MSRLLYDQTSTSLFRPDAHHRSVQAIQKDQKLSSDERLAILSAWASDMYAVESSPGLRMIPGHAAPLCLSEILDAHRSLDDDDPPPRSGGSTTNVSGGHRSRPAIRIDAAGGPPTGSLATRRILARCEDAGASRQHPTL